jgi:hypothetical protein
LTPPFTEDDQTTGERDRRAGEAAVSDDHDTADDEQQRSRSHGRGARREAIEHGR